MRQAPPWLSPELPPNPAPRSASQHPALLSQSAAALLLLPLPRLHPQQSHHQHQHQHPHLLPPLQPSPLLLPHLPCLPLRRLHLPSATTSTAAWLLPCTRRTHSTCRARSLLPKLPIRPSSSMLQTQWPRCSRRIRRKLLHMLLLLSRWLLHMALSGVTPMPRLQASKVLAHLELRACT